MPDAKQWIEDITRVEPPELWESIEGRTNQSAFSPAPRRTPRRLLAAAVLAISAVVLGGVLYAMRPSAQPSGGDVTPLDNTSAPTPTVDTSPTPENGDALQIAGVPFLVCRVTAVSGNFGNGMTTAWVFEEERVPGAGCVGSEGFQHVAVGSDGRAEMLSPRITDVLTDAAWKVWAYAAPDMNGDGIDEIAISTVGEQALAIHLWLFTVADGQIETVSDATREPIDCGPDCDPTAWDVEIGPITRKNGAVSDSGLSCGLPRPEDRDALVYWQADTEDPLHVHLSKWRLDGRTLEPAGDGELFIDGSPGAYPPSGLDGLCGSPTSISPNYLTSAGGSTDGLGVDDPPGPKIPFVQARIDQVEGELATLDTSTSEGAAKAEFLNGELAALRAALARLCEEAGQPEGC